MNRIFKKEQIVTVPNLLSIVRLLLIPFIVYLYCFKQMYIEAVVFIVLSGITDVVDGIIARKFDMVSDFGKILDPIADKLTQITVIFCIATRVPEMWLIVGMFIAKEVIMLLMGMVAIKKLDSINSARWYGKLNTVVLYATIILFIIFPNMPSAASITLLLICAVSLVISLGLYIRFYLMLFRKNTMPKENNNA